MPTEPSNTEILSELQALRRIVEKHLPDAVASKQDREEVRLKETRRRQSAERAAARAAGRNT